MEQQLGAVIYEVQFRIGCAALPWACTRRKMFTGRWRRQIDTLMPNGDYNAEHEQLVYYCRAIPQ